MESTTVAFLVIGSELLDGTVAEQNVFFLAKRLHELGSELKRVVFVPDNVDEIALEVRRLSVSCDYLITSGGLGPSINDVTVLGVAKALNQQVVRHTYLETIVSRFFKGADLTAAQARLGTIPEQGELLVRDGMQLPQIYVHNVYMLPGQPQAFQVHFNLIADLFTCPTWHKHTVIVKSLETVVAPFTFRVSKQFPQVNVATLPLEGGRHNQARPIAITLESKHKEQVEEAFSFLRSALPSELEIIESI